MINFCCSSQALIGRRLNHPQEWQGVSQKQDWCLLLWNDFLKYKLVTTLNCSELKDLLKKLEEPWKGRWYHCCCCRRCCCCCCCCRRIKNTSHNELRRSKFERRTQNEAQLGHEQLWLCGCRQVIIQMVHGMKSGLPQTFTNHFTRLGRNYFKRDRCLTLLWIRKVAAAAGFGVGYWRQASLTSLAAAAARCVRSGSSARLAAPLVQTQSRRRRRKCKVNEK